MCFSASASFVGGVVLTGIGVASLKQVQHKSQIVFACIPLFFAAQQIIEGFVWVSFATPFNASLNLSSTYGFLIFAEIIWPLWIPIAMIMVENRRKRHKIQLLFVTIGVIEAIYQIYCLINYPVHSEIIGHHVYYALKNPPALKYPEAAFYVTAIIVSPFFTSIKRMWMVGLAILISCIITILFYQHYFVSVWCFFASAISISVYLIMREIKPSYKTPINTGH